MMLQLQRRGHALVSIARGTGPDAFAAPRGRHTIAIESDQAAMYVRHTSSGTAGRA
jgi:hypothetical protein